MTLKEAVITWLLTKTTITDVVGQRIRPNRAPQEEDRPLLVVSMPASSHDYHAGGPTGLREAVIQIDCEAEGEKAAADLGELVAAAISGFQGTMGADGEGAGGVDVRSAMIRDLRDTSSDPADGGETGFPSVRIAVDVWHKLIAS